MNLLLIDKVAEVLFAAGVLGDVKLKFVVEPMDFHQMKCDLARNSRYPHEVFFSDELTIESVSGPVTLIRGRPLRPSELHVEVVS